MLYLTEILSLTFTLNVSVFILTNVTWKICGILVLDLFILFFKIFIYLVLFVELITVLSVKLIQPHDTHN